MRETELATGPGPEAGRGRVVTCLRFRRMPLAAHSYVSGAVPYLDGKSLLDIVGEHEVRLGYRQIIEGQLAGPGNGPLTEPGRPLSPYYLGYDCTLPDGYFLGQEHDQARSEGRRIKLLGCICGADGCASLSAIVTTSAEIVTWTSFRHDRRPNHDLAGIAPMIFSRALYDRALAELEAEAPEELEVPLESGADDEGWTSLFTKVHSLYIANREGRPWSGADQAELFDMITPAFPGFTVMEAKGFFQGRPTPTLVVLIATDDTQSVRNLGEQIRARFHQQAVGLALDGTYSRLTGN